MALQTFINIWAMATTEYETTYTPARTKIIKCSLEMASTIALRNIVHCNTINIQWTESAYKYIKRRMLSIKMLSSIIEHLLPPPEITEEKKYIRKMAPMEPRCHGICRSTDGRITRS